MLLENAPVSPEVTSLITPLTRVFSLLGTPVTASPSPAMQNAAFAACSVDAVYVAFDIGPGRFAEAFHGAASLGISGLNITVPFKEEAMGLMDELDETASRIGAVNTVVFKNGRAIGYNTDAAGFLAALGRLGMHPAGRRAAVFGAGGAARAIAFALASEGIRHITLLNRTVERAENLAGGLKELYPGISVSALPVCSKHSIIEIGMADLVVQATSSREIPAAAAGLRPEQVFVELITSDTPILQFARKAGCRCQDGIEMLIGQGSRAFTIWTGLPAPIEAMRSAVSTIREQ